jgi:hypothetical protein
MVSHFSTTIMMLTYVHSKDIPVSMEKNELALSDHEDIIDSTSVIGQ